MARFWIKNVLKTINKSRIAYSIAILVLLLIIVDLSNIDSLLHKWLCTLFGTIFPTVCPDYYDLPIWEASVAFGTLSAAYFAYGAIRESNKRLELEQAPYVVLQYNISLASDRLHTISVKNTGKGLAANIRATTDPKGEISIIEVSNSHTIELKSGEVNTGWAIDENQVIKGLKKQGVNIISSIVKEIPKEEDLSDEEKSRADFHIFLWYEDQMGYKYMTVIKIRHSGYFFKVMENKVQKI